VEFELNESTSTLTIVVRGSRFELLYDKMQDKWMAKDSTYQLNRIVGEFNLHCDVVQLLATLRYVAAQTV